MIYASIADFAAGGLPSSSLPVASSVWGSFAWGEYSWGSSYNSIVAWALKRASSKLDGYLKKRYTLPLISWGPDLEEATIAFAVWFVLHRQGFNPNAGYNEAARVRYEDAEAWALRVSTGDLEPDLVDSTPTYDEASPLVESGKVLFSVKDWMGVKDWCCK